MEKDTGSSVKDSSTLIHRSGTTASYLSKPTFSDTEIQVIKGAYGLGKDKRRRSTSELSIGMHLPEGAILQAEGSGLVKLKMRTDIARYLESRTEIGALNDNENILLDAVRSADPENEKPYLLESSYSREEDKNDRGTENTDTGTVVDSTDGSGVLSGDGGVAESVGRVDKKPKSPGKSKRKSVKAVASDNTESAGADKTGTVVDTGLSITIITATKPEQFDTLLTATMSGSVIDLVEVTTVENSRNKVVEISALLARNIYRVPDGAKPFSSPKPQFSKTFVGTIASVEMAVNSCLKERFRNYTKISFSSWFDTMVSRIRHSVTLVSVDPFC